MCPLVTPCQVANPGPEEPDAGNPHVRVCEGGEGAIPLPYLDARQDKPGKGESDVERSIAETFLWNPVGTQAHPAKLATAGTESCAAPGRPGT